MTDYNSNTSPSRTAKGGTLRDLDSIAHTDTRCGCPPACTPSWSQRLANPKVFTVHVMLTLSFSMMSFVYLGGVLTTIERNFQLDSSEAGSITIAADVISTIFVLPLSHYGQKGHRPRWIGVGLLFTALGTFLCSMPHFLSDPIDPDVLLTGAGDVSPEQDLCKENLQYQTVSPGSSGNASEIEMEQGHSGTGSGSLRSVWWIILGQILIGIGHAPFYPLVTTYIDDGVKKHNLTAYTAVLFIAFTIGPSCGFLFAGVTTSKYVDFDRVPPKDIPSIDQSDPRWIGAWWLGFVILSIIIVILTVPYFFYPRTLASAVKKWKEEEKERAMEGEEEHQTEDATKGLELKEEEQKAILNGTTGSAYKHLEGEAIDDVLKGPFLALKRLLTNKTNMCIVFYEAVFLSKIAIFAAFGLKYIQTQFGLSPSQAAFITAIMLGPSNILSQIFSAYICRRFKLNSKQCALFVVLGSGIGLLLYPAGLFLGCDTAPIAGVTTHYDGTVGSYEPSIINECNSDCTCSAEVFQPICGSNGLTYISPCLAGCSTDHQSTNVHNSSSDSYQGNTTHTFSNCRCILNSAVVSPSNESGFSVYKDLSDNSEGVADATAGQCREPCRGFIPITILLTITLFLQTTTQNPGMYVAMRCVREEDRSMAMGLRSVSGHVLGFFPAPIYFGAIINSVCIHWQWTNGERGACWVYDITMYRYAYFGTTMALEGIALVFLVLMYFSIKEDLVTKTEKNDYRQCDNVENGGVTSSEL